MTFRTRREQLNVRTEKESGAAKEEIKHSEPEENRDSAPRPPRLRTTGGGRRGGGNRRRSPAACKRPAVALPQPRRPARPRRRFRSLNRIVASSGRRSFRRARVAKEKARPLRAPDDGGPPLRSRCAPGRSRPLPASHGGPGAAAGYRPGRGAPRISPPKTTILSASAGLPSPASSERVLLGRIALSERPAIACSNNAMVARVSASRLMSYEAHS